MCRVDIDGKEWWWHVTENAPQHQLFKSWTLGSAGAFSLKLEATAAWLVGDMLCSRICVTREELTNQIASGRINRRYAGSYRDSTEAKAQAMWVTGQSQALNKRWIENSKRKKVGNFLTFPAMEGFWNNEGNGVTPFQTCWPRESRSDSWNISVQTHAA